MRPRLRSLPSWLSLVGALLLAAPVLPACAQTPAAKQPAAPAPSAPAASPAGNNSTPAVSKRAEAYYHDALAAIYEQQAINRGQPDDITRAIEEYKYALDNDPTSASLQNGLADLYYRSGRMQDAESTVQILLKSSPDNIPANKLLGRIYLRQLSQQNVLSSPAESTSALNKAIGQFEKIVSLEPKNVDDRLVLGQLYTVNHQTDKAEAEFKAAQAIQPDSEEIILNLVRIYAQTGNLKQAAKVIEAVPMDNRTPRMEYALGATYDQLKDKKSAVAAFQRAYEMDPESLRALNALAQTLYQDNQLDASLGYYNRLAAADPENANAYIHISEIQRRQGHYKQALASILKARKLDPTSLDAGYNEGLLLDVLGQFDDAVKAYQQMVDLTSHANGAYTAAEKNNRSIFLERLGGVYQEQNQTDLAVAAYQKMIDMGGDSALRGYQDQIQAYQTAHEPSKAIAVTHKAIAAFPANVGMKLILAGEMADQGQVDQGFALAQAQLKNKPSDLIIWETMAQMNIRLRRWKKAEKDLNKAQPLATKNSEKAYLLFLRGEWAERQNHVAPAVKYFQQALALEPSSAMTLNYLGYMLANRGLKLPQALKWIQQAVNLDPSNAAYLDSLGWVYYKLGDYELAEHNLRSAVSRDQTDPTVRMHLGDVYEKTGRIRLAAAQWKLSLAEFAKTNPADFNPSDPAKVKKKLANARVKLAKEDSVLNPTKRPE
jgi:tetratricopeptide (TPR) repeat protein